MIISRPIYTEEDVPSSDYVVEMNARRHAYIQEYLNVEPWKCHECNATMFGRMTYCAYCRFKLNKDTPRRVN